jgi:hypothetical protein
MAPRSLIASRAYCEQLGVNRQRAEGPKKATTTGEMTAW